MGCVTLVKVSVSVVVFRLFSFLTLVSLRQPDSSIFCCCARLFSHFSRSLLMRSSHRNIGLHRLIFRPLSGQPPTRHQFLNTFLHSKLHSQFLPFLLLSTLLTPAILLTQFFWKSYTLFCCFSRPRTHVAVTHEVSNRIMSGK